MLIQNKYIYAWIWFVNNFKLDFLNSLIKYVLSVNTCTMKFYRLQSIQHVPVLLVNYHHLLISGIILLLHNLLPQQPIKIHKIYMKYIQHVDVTFSFVKRDSICILIKEYSNYCVVYLFSYMYIYVWILMHTENSKGIEFPFTKATSA